MKRLSFAGIALACALLGTDPAHAASINGMQQVVVCDPTTNQGQNCVKPNSDGSISTSAGGVTSYSTTDKGGTIATGGTAQAAIASNASRKIWCIQNDPAATENLSVRLNGTASATAGIILQAGVQACSAPGALDTAAVSVFGATTGHRFFGFEGQ